MDVVVVGDFRFPGGTSTSVVSEVRALASAGYSVALLSLATGPLGSTRGIHDGIRELADRGEAIFVRPSEAVSARLCCLHHPSVFEVLPAIPPRVECGRVVMIVHHPPLDAYGVPQYDIGKVMGITSELFGQVFWAPVGPKVRDAFRSARVRPPLTSEDWHNIIDPEDFAEARRRLPMVRPFIGRHSRPQAIKWPDDRATFLDAYPDDGAVDVRLMGYSAELDDVVEERPANWEVLPFGAMPVADFLGTLKYFSYYHSEEWIEAFGRSVLEAMAAGLICFLAPDFQTLFGDGAVYCEPADVMEQVRRFEADPALYDEQSKRAIDCVRRSFGPEKAVARVRALVGAPKARLPAAPTQPAGVLYLTSNGIGMGHIARCMASARRLPPDCKPTFVTMSKAFGVARDQGFDVEYLPYFRSIGLGYQAWAGKLTSELMQVFRFHRPEVFVFDGNVPYDPLVEVLQRFPDMWKVWQRRPLWRPGVGREYLEMSRHFDVVLEPAELADPVDRGLTRERKYEAHCVPPVTFLDRDELLDRSAARYLLGLNPDQPALLLQLGSGNNFKISDIVRIVCELADPGRAKRPVQLVFARWRISQKSVPLPDFVRTLDTFPIARYLNAFDCAVAFAGYNTFHENIAACLPTLFTSNDHPEQDEQWLRADYAELRGLAFSARTSDMFRFRRRLRQLLDPAERERLRIRCVSVEHPNGSHAAAQFISGLARTSKRNPLVFHSASVLAT